MDHQTARDLSDDSHGVRVVGQSNLGDYTLIVPSRSETFADITSRLAETKTNIYIVPEDIISIWESLPDDIRSSAQLLHQSNGFSGLKWRTAEGKKVKMLDYHGIFATWDDYSREDIREALRELIASYDRNFHAGANPFHLPTLAGLGSQLYRCDYLRQDLRIPLGPTRYMAYRSVRAGGIVAARPGHYNGDYAVYDAKSAYTLAAIYTSDRQLLHIPHGYNYTDRMGKIDYKDYPAGIFYARVAFGNNAPWGGIYPNLGDDISERYQPRTEHYYTGYELAYFERAGADIRLSCAVLPREYWRPDRSFGSFAYNCLDNRARAHSPLVASHFKALGNHTIGRLGQAHRGGFVHSEIDGGPSFRSGTLQIPEWLTHILAVFRVGLFEVLQGRDWKHISTDSVIMPYSRDEIPTSNGQIYQLRARGDELIVFSNNRWILCAAGEIVDYAFAGISGLKAVSSVLRAYRRGKGTTNIVQQGVRPTLSDFYYGTPPRETRTISVDLSVAHA